MFHLKHLAEIVLPRVCSGCGSLNPLGVCDTCLARFRRVPREPLCFICRQEGRAGSRHAGFGCTQRDHSWALGAAVFWMENPLDRVIHTFKYRHAKVLGILLGRLVAREIPVQEGWAGVCVPMTRVRLRERGFNQTELLLRSACRLWGLPAWSDALQRVRQRKPQAQQDLADRSENVKGSFRASASVEFRGRTWVLLDDVATTGATLVGVMESMRRRGAERVVPVALALA